MGAEPKKVIEVKNVRKVYRMGNEKIYAVDDVSFQVYKGEVHVLIGENGAGKSTVMKMIAGLYPIDSGHLRLDGEDYLPQNVAHASSLGDPSFIRNSI